MRPLVHVGVHGGAPLLLGGGMYVLLRGWAIPGMGALEIGALAPVRDRLPDVVLFSLPDALWIYALVSVLGALHHERGVRTGWLGAAVVVGVGWELGQLAGLIAGTFDPADLVLSLAAAALGWCVAERSHHSSAGA